MESFDFGHDRTTVETFTYDAVSRLVTDTMGAVATNRYYSKQDQVLEEQSGGNWTARYVWSPVYVNALIFRDTPASGTRVWAEQDANYNVVVLVGASGAVVERFDYSAFGVQAATGSITNWAYGWQGMRLDAVSGWVESESRWYSPSLGNWTSVDPLGFGGGDVREYGFEGNTSLGSCDPSGSAEVTDESVLKASAVSDPTFTSVERWRGKTITASNDKIAKGFSVRFTFERADLASFKIGTTPRKGIFVRIKAVPSENICQKGDTLQILQIYRQFTLAPTGLTTVTTDDDANTQNLSGANHPDEKNNVGWGWALDYCRRTKSPYFGEDGIDVTRAGDNGPLTMWDIASNQLFDKQNVKVLNQGFEVTTFLVSRKKNGDNLVLGGVTWGYYIDDKGDVHEHPGGTELPIAVDGGPTPILRAAVNRWNESGIGVKADNINGLN